MKLSTQAGCSSIVSGGVPPTIIVSAFCVNSADGISSNSTLIDGFLSMKALKVSSKTLWSSGDEDQ